MVSAMSSRRFSLSNERIRAPVTESLTVVIVSGALSISSTLRINAVIGPYGEIENYSVVSREV
jgi:hypothetical protein